MLEKPPIDQIVRTIAERFDPERIILFGSYARGDARPDSDLDIFVEMESDLSPPRRASRIRAAFGLYPWAMDILVYTPQEVRRHGGAPGTVLSSIEREGRIVYDRRGSGVSRVAPQGRA